MVKRKKVFCIINIVAFLLALGASGFFAWQVVLVFQNHQLPKLFLVAGIAAAALNLICILLFVIYFEKYKKPVNIEEDTEKDVNDNQEQVIEEHIVEEPVVDEQVESEEQEKPLPPPPPKPPKLPKAKKAIKKDKDKEEQEKSQNEILKEKIKVKPVIAPKMIVPQKPEIKAEGPKQSAEIKKPPLPPKPPKKPAKVPPKPPQKPNI